MMPWILIASVTAGLKFPQLIFLPMRIAVSRATAIATGSAVGMMRQAEVALAEA